MPKIKKLTLSERREQIKQHLKLAPELSSRAISRQVGCSHVTVEKIRKEMIQAGQLTNADTTPDWQLHPYFVANREVILNKLDARGLSALKAPGVLDLMKKRGSLSPQLSGYTE